MDPEVKAIILRMAEKSRPPEQFGNKPERGVNFHFV